MKISYGITVCTELTELQKLIKFLSEIIRPEDEIVVLIDSTNGIIDVKNLLILYSETFDNFSWYEHPLNKNFAAQKNFLNKQCSGDYIFQLDADELPAVDLIENLPNILESNLDVDLFYVPRINIVNGITMEHAAKWGWNLNDKGWINFPDYQHRIYRNKPEIKWKNPVHEVIIGQEKQSLLPLDEIYCLYHEKTIDKQEKQNEFYNTI